MNIRRTTAIAAATCVALAGAAVAQDAHWTYEGDEGPEHWGELSEEFEACAGGAQQSPIDIETPVNADVAPVAPDWSDDVEWTVENNGHTVQATPEGEAGGFDLNGTHYELAQFHFHHPSEHAVDGERFPLEAHFVHLGEDGTIAVVGVMLDGGGATGPLDRIMQAATDGDSDIGTIDPADLLPEAAASFRYEGSLTTPPCSEVVHWIVMRDHVEVSNAAVAAFTELYPSDARPLQPLNRRIVLSSGG